MTSNDMTSNEHAVKMLGHRQPLTRTEYDERHEAAAVLEEFLLRRVAGYPMPDGTPWSIAERVAHGAAWLDVNKPGWVERVDVELLDMTSCSWCVLGQVYGYFFGAPFFGDLDEREAIVFARSIGCYPNTPPGDACAAEIDELTTQWRRVVYDRQQQTSRR